MHIYNEAFGAIWRIRLNNSTAVAGIFTGESMRLYSRHENAHWHHCKVSLYRHFRNTHDAQGHHVESWHHPQNRKYI